LQGYSLTPNQAPAHPTPQLILSLTPLLNYYILYFFEAQYSISLCLRLVNWLGMDCSNRLNFALVSFHLQKKRPYDLVFIVGLLNRSYNQSLVSRILKDQAASFSSWKSSFNLAIEFHPQLHSQSYSE